MTEPRTEAGRRLVDWFVKAARLTRDGKHGRALKQHILAIEEEAAAPDRAGLLRERIEARDPDEPVMWWVDGQGREWVSRDAALAATGDSEGPLDVDTLQAAENCLVACANDEREPERYREWYAGALVKVRAAIARLSSKEADHD